jgi:hypothetical protein
MTHRFSPRFRRHLAASSASVLTVAVVGAVLLLGQPGGGAGRVDPVPVPRPVAPGVPVWYDADGLHRGSEVFDVSVDLLGGRARAGRALALAGNGALYLDPATGDVWFQPWQGVPRVVGRGSRHGPGADPDGTTAAWFEGGRLVVFDTGRGEEVARTATLRPVGGAEEHLLGNGFRYVDADEVVWTDGRSVLRYDLDSDRVDVVWEPAGLPGLSTFVRDRHDGWLAWADGAADGARVTRLSGEPVASFAAPEMYSLFSPDGRYLLASTMAGGHRAVVGAVPTGEVWFPAEAAGYPWLGWSYGNVAMVVQDSGGAEDTLLGCDVEARECTRLSHRGPVLLPTS